MAFRDRLSKMIEGRGISDRELARNIGLSPNTVERWLKGEIQPRLDQAAAVAAYFKVPLGPLVDDSWKHTAAGPEITKEEFAVLTAFRAAGIGEVEAARRLQTVIVNPRKQDGPMRGEREGGDGDSKDGDGGKKKGAG
jgi:transcriptional regulator with XRE-family HTH domain